MLSFAAAGRRWVRRIWHAVVLALGFTLAGTGGNAGDFQAGLDAAHAGDYVTAHAEWLPLAEQGDANAQYNLGNMYSLGDGVDLDFTQAAHWYRLAAEQGNMIAQFNLGVMYEVGHEIGQDFGEAAHWYGLAAAQGDADAQSNLGVLYAQGKGVGQDFVEAERWWHLAAEQGHFGAQRNLGLMYSLDHAGAADVFTGLMWLNISVANGALDAVEERDQLAHRMMQAKVAEAARRGQLFIQSNYTDCE